jgi:L-malate glycosyltransferase
MSGTTSEATGKVKLLHFLTSFETGGTERHAVALTGQLDRSRFEPHFACLRKRGQFLASVEADGIPIACFPIRRLFGWRTLLQQERFGRYLRSHRFQIVHTYGFYPNVFALPAARLAGIPVVLASIRDSGDIWTRAQRRVQGLVCRRLAHRTLVNAEAVRDQLVTEGYRREAIGVIRNGIDLSRFATLRDPGGLREAFGLAPGVPVVTAVSRLYRFKGLEDFLEALGDVSRRFEQARFLIVGEGPSRADLEARAWRLGLGGRLTFTGLRQDIPEILSMSTVSVLPSLSEGLSNVLLESMAAGTPVVATRVGGTPEVIQDDVTGLLVPSSDPPALARAIGSLLEDPPLALRLGRMGRERVASHFSLERATRETEDLYLKLLAARRPGEALDAGPTCLPCGDGRIG